MAFQRKVFRIEQCAAAHASEPAAASAPPEQTPRHHETIAELQALRALLEPRAHIDREALERARAQIAEAQAYKYELDLIYAALKRTRDEIGALGGAGAPSGEHTVRAGRELAAIVSGTEQATQSILQATEEIDQAAGTLTAVLKSGHEQGLAHDIQDRVVQIFEACNFQDLTGQRVAKVLASLQYLEDHVMRLMEIWHGVEQFKPVVLGEAANGERHYLNGPKLPNDAGHSSQSDIDGLFEAAKLRLTPAAG